MSGCPAGPETDSPALTATERDARIEEIAAGFVESANLDAARSELDVLQLANAPQAVLALAESHIVSDGDSAATANLVMLAQALGPISRMVDDYLAEKSGDGQGSAPAQEAAQVQPTETPAPTDAPEPTATPTDTPEPTATPTNTPEPAPQVVVDSQALNVRSGPSILYPRIGQMRQGQQAPVTASNADRTWWQVKLDDASAGWVAGSLVTLSGPLEGVPVAQDIPPPPATPTPAATPTPVPPTATPKPAVDFVIVTQRMLTINENQGCVGNHNIFVRVVDVNGNPLNGVAVKRIWAGVEKFSGSKESDYLGRPGQGWLQFDLYKSGDQAVVVRDADGREVTSQTTRSLEVEDEKIGAAELMSHGYCPSIEECGRLISENRLCRYHYSYEVVFQRQY